MSEYTITSDNIYFLNDKNIASALKYDDIKINPIPSLDLVSSLYNQLSSEDADLRNYSKELCASISNAVDVRRVEDKAELSNVLSVYTNRRVSKLSTSLSTEVNRIFVHNTGDTISGTLSVQDRLFVGETAEFEGDVKLDKNLTQGKGSFVNSTIDRGIAMGISACSNKDDAFVWNGDNNVDDHYYALEVGSFNINPAAGVNGFFIGSKNISTIIHDDVELTAKSLTVDISAISAELCATVDERRKQDKTELSNVLSTYANGLCSDISNTVNVRRTEDKYELSNTLSTYANQLCSEISGEVVRSKFAYCTDDTVKFWYQSDTTTHALWFELSGINDSKVHLSVDTTDFIKDRILKKAEVCYNEETPPVLVLRLYWNSTEPTIGEYTDIKIQDLAKIYKASTGIQITEDLSISVIDYDGIVTSLRLTSGNVDTLSNNIIPTLSTNLSDVGMYIDKLSNENITNLGIIPTLSLNLSALSVNINNDVKTLSTEIIPEIKTDVDSVSAHANEIQTYVDKLSGGHTAGSWKGDIPYLSDCISANSVALMNTATFRGTKVTFDKYDPAWDTETELNLISTFFKYIVNNGDITPIKNGSVYQIEFSNPAGHNMDLTDPVYAADQYYDFGEDVEDVKLKIRIAHQDVIAVYIIDGHTTEIQLSDLNTDTVHIMSDTKFYERNMLSVETYDSTLWLSGGNTLDVIYNVGISSDAKTPKFIKRTGHAISGDNDILGPNRFHGFTSMEELSVLSLTSEYEYASRLDVVDLSVKNNLSVGNKLSVANEVDFLSGNVTVVDGLVTSKYKVAISDDVEISTNLIIDNKLSVTDANITSVKDIYENGDLSVSGNTTLVGTVNVSNDVTVFATLTADVDLSTLYVENLSTGTLSADWEKVVTPTGYSLYDLSTDLSHKIWIKNPDATEYTISAGDYSNLSVVKISKDAYENSVVEQTLSHDVLYVISSDYIDAYEQVISCLSTPGADGVSNAANTLYVDNICADLSIEISSVRQVFKDLYNKINTITLTSYLSDIISAVVEIKDAILKF